MSVTVGGTVTYHVDMARQVRKQAVLAQLTIGLKFVVRLKNIIVIFFLTFCGHNMCGCKAVRKLEHFKHRHRATYTLYMFLFSESYLSQPVKNAVVTVPAYFNDSQRQVKARLYCIRHSSQRSYLRRLIDLMLYVWSRVLEEPPKRYLPLKIIHVKMQIPVAIFVMMANNRIHLWKI